MLTSSAALAQELSEEDITGDVEDVQMLAEIIDEKIGAEDEEDKKYSFVAMPIPLANPTLGYGLGINAMTLYSLGENAPPSSSGIFGFYTDTTSWMGGIYQMVHTKDDLWRGIGALGVGSFKVNFYGIGQDPGEAGRALPITQDISFIYLQALREVRDNLYLGLRGRSSETVTTIRLSEIIPPEWEIPDPQFDSIITNIGPVVQWDSRDNIYKPVSGTLVEAVALFADDALASDFSYQMYNLEYSQFFKLRKNLVLAVRGTGCTTQGDAPFYDICNLGSDDKIRGYEAGQYRDYRMLTAQIEARWQFSKSWGTVAFGGGAWLAESFDDLSFGDTLPSYGVGIRYLASEEHQVNIGIDYARGEDSGAWYFRIGEAF